MRKSTPNFGLIYSYTKNRNRLIDFLWRFASAKYIGGTHPSIDRTPSPGSKKIYLDTLTLNHSLTHTDIPIFSFCALNVAAGVPV